MAFAHGRPTAIALVFTLVAGLELCTMCASRALHLHLLHSRFRVERDAHVDAGLQIVPAAVGLVVICNCHRLGGRGSVVDVQSRQRAWAEVIELRAHGEWSVTVFETLGVAVAAVAWILAVVIDHRKRLVFGQARMIERRGRSLCMLLKDSSWVKVCSKAKQSRIGEITVATERTSQTDGVHSSKPLCNLPESMCLHALVSDPRTTSGTQHSRRCTRWSCATMYST